MGGAGPIQPACMFAEGAGGGLEGWVGVGPIQPVCLSAEGEGSSLEGWVGVGPIQPVCLLREQGVVWKYGCGWVQFNLSV